MEKTYKVLDNMEVLPIKEIKRLYTGYWVYLVKCELGVYGEILSGIPVVCGSMAYDGADDGIYNKYRTPEYEVRADLNLLPNNGFISSLQFVRGGSDE